MSRVSRETQRRMKLSKKTQAAMSSAEHERRPLVEPTPASAQRERRAELRAEFYANADPHGDARSAVADDPVLAPRFAEYEAAGGPAIDLRAVPRHRQAQAVEEAMDVFHGGRSASPCAACGSYAHRWPQVLDPLHVDATTRPPAHAIRRVEIHDATHKNPTVHQLLLCGWCDDQRSWRSEGIVGLAKAIFAATAGYHGTIGQARAYLAFERPEQVTGRPWAHVNSASAVGHARAAIEKMQIARSRLVATPEQAAQLAAELPGVRPHVWTDVPRPAPLPVASPGESAIERRRREREQAEHAAFLKRKAVRSRHEQMEREQEKAVRKFMESHPVDPLAGLTGKDAEALDRLLSMHQKAHFDNGCRGNCVVGNYALTINLP